MTDAELMPIGDLEWDAKPGRPQTPTRVYRVAPLRRDRDVAPSSVWLYAKSDEEPPPDRAQAVDRHRERQREHHRRQRAKRRP